MYKIFFEDRYIEICKNTDTKSSKHNQIIRYKNRKSFYKALKDFKKDTNIISLLVRAKKPKKVFKLLKKKYKFIPAAGGLVINHEGKLLLIKRNGKWDLPKGKIEKGEKKRTAAIREVEEECGISSLSIINKIKKTYHTYHAYGKNVFKTTHWYLMQYHGNEKLKPQINENITQAVWKDKNEVKKCLNNMYSSLLEVVDIYLQSP